MRIGRMLALAVACGAAIPARADVLQASSTTLVTAGQSFRDGTLEKAIPVYELVSLSASEMKTSWAEFELTLSAWGAVDAGPIRFWQNGAPAGSRASGDVDVGYLRADLAKRRVTVRIGRQLVASGNARMIQIDGGQLSLALPAGFGLSAFVGAPVAPRFHFGRLGGETALQATRAELAYGGRVSWERPGLLELGASAVMAKDGSEVSRQEVGADLRLTPVHALHLLGSTFYSLYDKRLGQVEAAVHYEARRDLTFFADYQHVAPDLFLARNSILAAFVADNRNDVGGGLRWNPRRTATLEGDYHYLKEPDGAGHRVRVKGTLHPWGAGLAGAEVQYLTTPENGFATGRLFGAKEWGRLGATLDLWLYKYEKSVNGYDKSLGATITGGYAVSPSWKVLLAATAGSDPFYKSRTEVMAKLAWNQGYVREVR